MPSPRVTFSPQEGCPGCGQALEGLSGPIVREVAPYHNFRGLQKSKTETGVRTGFPPSSEANGHSDPRRVGRLRAAPNSEDFHGHHKSVPDQRGDWERPERSLPSTRGARKTQVQLEP